MKYDVRRRLTSSRISRNWCQRNLMRQLAATVGACGNWTLTTAPRVKEPTECLQTKNVYKPNGGRMANQEPDRYFRSEEGDTAYFPRLLPVLRAWKGLQPLSGALDPKRNSLNALRLVFASAVIVSHAWYLGGYGAGPALYGIDLGTACVMGFFAISGYLITLSAQGSRSVSDYLLARFTRIYPGLVLATLIVVLVAAPIGAVLTGGHYDLGDAFAFLATALGLTIGLLGPPAIGTSLQGNPDALNWNGPLWTLTWEAVCYLIVAVVVMSARRTTSTRSAPLASVFLFGALSCKVAVRLFQGGPALNIVDFAMPMMVFFLAGSVLAHFRERIPVGFLPIALSIAAAWAFLAAGLGPALAPLPLAYLVIAAGTLRTFSNIGSRYDISYGVYIYGWPVQQLLAALHVPAVLPQLGYAALALAVVWPLGFLSCVAIEQPAQRWRRAWLARQRSRIGESETSPS